MGGVFPKNTTIYIGTADQITTGLIHSSNAVVGEIESFNITGGGRDITSVPVIGGFVDQDMPPEQVEVAFDVIVSNSASSTLNRFDAFKFGADANSYRSDLTPTTRAIAVLMNTNGAAPFLVYAFNNCKGVTWEPTMSGDDMLRGTMTFKFSPTTNLGAPNLKSSVITSSTSGFPANWS